MECVPLSMKLQPRDVNGDMLGGLAHLSKYCCQWLLSTSHDDDDAFFTLVLTKLHTLNISTARKLNMLSGAATGLHVSVKLEVRSQGQG
jgi:hypothetical protein